MFINLMELWAVKIDASEEVGKKIRTKKQHSIVHYYSARRWAGGGSYILFVFSMEYDALDKCRPEIHTMATTTTIIILL